MLSPRDSKKNKTLTGEREGGFLWMEKGLVEKESGFCNINKEGRRIARPLRNSIAEGGHLFEPTKFYVNV